MRLFLIRHGQTAWNAGSRAQGHVDIPLDETGQHQAALLGQGFANETVARVLCSDLGRAIETARPIADATGAPMEVLPALRERSFGDWEGMSFAQIAAAIDVAQAVQGLDRFGVRPPNGESLEDVWARLAPVVVRLHRIEEPTAVVTHGGTASLLMAQMLGGPLTMSRAFRFQNTGITELSRMPDGQWTLARYNDIRHLESVHRFETVGGGGIDGTTR